MGEVFRRRPLWLAAVPIALVLIPAVLLASQRPSAAGSTVLTIFTGTVALAHGTAEFTIASDGEILAKGDRVRADADGHALITFFDGSTLAVDPSSTVQIDNAAANANGSIAIELTQSLGRTWASVQKLTRTDSRFEIRTPSSTAAVRGTAFLTEVLSNGETRVETSDGTVAVSAQGTTVLVTAGLTTTVEPNRPPTPPSAAPRPANTLRFGMHSPAYLMVVDPLGRSCGISANGPTVVRHIPGCVASGPGTEPQLVDVPNAPAGTYRTVITAIDPGGTFTLTAAGLDAGGSALFDLSAQGDGQPGAVFGSALDVRVGPDGSLSTSGLAPLVVLQGPSPSPSPSSSPEPSQAPSPSPTATPTEAPAQSFVPKLRLPTLPVSTPTPTPQPTATPTASPVPTASPSPSPSPTPAPTATPAPTVKPTQGCVPSSETPRKCSNSSP